MIQAAIVGDFFRVIHFQCLFFASWVASVTPMDPPMFLLLFTVVKSSFSYLAAPTGWAH